MCRVAPGGQARARDGPPEVSARRTQLSLLPPGSRYPTLRRMALAKARGTARRAALSPCLRHASHSRDAWRLAARHRGVLSASGRAFAREGAFAQLPPPRQPAPGGRATLSRRSPDAARAPACEAECAGAAPARGREFLPAPATGLRFCVRATPHLPPPPRSSRSSRRLAKRPSADEIGPYMAYVPTNVKHKSVARMSEATCGAHFEHAGFPDFAFAHPGFCNGP
jgi:hypothetical protein